MQRFQRHPQRAPRGAFATVIGGLLTGFIVLIERSLRPWLPSLRAPVPVRLYAATRPARLR